MIKWTLSICLVSELVYTYICLLEQSYRNIMFYTYNTLFLYTSLLQENKFINPYVIRYYGEKTGNQNVVEMQNMTAVTDANAWVRLSSPMSKSTTFFQGTNDSPRKKRNSLYDYGMGASVRNTIVEREIGAQIVLNSFDTFETK